MRRGGELCYHSACQSKSPGFETKVVYAMRAARSATRHCSAGPIRGGLGYRWLVSPNGIEPYLSRTGLDLLRSNLCTFFINNNNIYKYRITLKNFFFFILTYLQTVPLRYVIVNLIKFVSYSCVHSLVRGCSRVGKWNIKFEMGMGLCRFGMEHLAQRERTAGWLLVAVCALVLVSVVNSAI